MNWKRLLARHAAADQPTLDPLEKLRRRGIQAWALVAWASLVLLLIGNALLGAGVGVPIIVVGVLVSAGPTLMAVRGRYDAEARTLTGSLAAVFPAMLVFLLKGHPWQMDAHMYFFVSMAALVMLADWRPILLATALTAAHHLSLEWLAPAWVFPGSGNLGRVAFHVVAVGLQFCALAMLTMRLERLLLSQQDALRRSHKLTCFAESEQRQAQRTMMELRVAETEAASQRRRREEQIIRAAADRQGELITLANEFERCVNSIVTSIGQAAEQLEHTAVQLEEASAGASRDAVEAASGATRAASDITGVAASLRGLSGSIRTIAAAVDRQSELTICADKEAEESVVTVAMLEGHAVEIEGFLDDIRDIASKTNLLSLNATIEAARAGDAGRGFAIVAGEIKSLSGDTRRASDRIRTLIAGIRGGVAETGDKLRSVNGAIRQVSSAAFGIADAVRDQRSAAEKVDIGVERAVGAADNIDSRIGGVAKAIATASSLSESVRDSARDLAISARELRSSSALFVSFLRSDEAMAA